MIAQHFFSRSAIKFAVMVTPEDLNANAEYIKMADQVDFHSIVSIMRLYLSLSLSLSSTCKFPVDRTTTIMRTSI